MKKLVTGVLIVGGVVTLVALSETTSFGDGFNGKDAVPVESKEVQVSVEAKELLRQSAEAMAGLTSFHLEGEVVEESNDDVKKTTVLSADLVLDEDPGLHTKSTTTSSDGEAAVIEMFVSEESMNIKTGDQWVSVPMPEGQSSNILKGFKGVQVDELVGENIQWEVQDKGDQYLITSNEAAPKLNDVTPGVVNELMGKSGNEGETTDGNVEILIDKETFYLSSLTTTYDTDEESHTAKLTISDVNQVEKLTKPEGLGGGGSNLK
ncbi:DUF6612 family protein [Halobacillus litoralis]|uniref:DUF6612 family protein n=1 Tax=Halobacillus litoralis TaxID=45668 RepID=UPI0024900152|nr:DUF6612 family protein [Halobacillus litoralis]